MIQNWIFYAIAVLFLITMALFSRVKARFNETERIIEHLSELLDISRKDANTNYEKIAMLEKLIETRGDTMQVYMTTLNNKISDMEKRMDILEQNLMSVQETMRKEESVSVDSEESKQADIPDQDEPNEECGITQTNENNETVSYKWIFPAKEQCTPVAYGRYIVVGILHGHETMNDGSPFICTEEATWVQYRFVTDTNERFDKVYAYIRMPDSSDIMKSILEIALHDEEG